MQNQYFITYYCGIPDDLSTEAGLQQIIDCGFNLMQVYQGNVKRKQEILRYCEEKGIRACVHDHRLSGLCHGNWQERLNHVDEMENAIKAVCEDYRDYPALYSYNLIDEPASEKFPLLGKIVELVKKYDPDHFCYINLLPNYASNEQLGNDSYPEHLREFVDVVKPHQISYDNYYFMTDNRPDYDIDITDIDMARDYVKDLHRIDRTEYFDNFEDVRRFGLENNIPYMAIVLLTEHGDFRYLLPEEIRYEAFQTLVYGCKTMSYFRYWASAERFYPYWRDQNSCISGDVVCQHYYDVQAVNAEIRPIGDYIAKTLSEAVFHVGEEVDNVQFFTSYNGITGIAGGRFSVGFYTDGSFLIANKDYLNATLCTVETEAELEMLDTKTGEFIHVPEKQFNIPAGGGVYLRKR